MRESVANFKGGVVKTTTAIRLAAFLAKQGETLLLDGDPNRGASAWARKGQLPFTVADIGVANSLCTDAWRSPNWQEATYASAFFGA